ncbi:MAG: 3-isopropylmalate dehydratase small subunit [Alphaproteobacteria bacterium]|nr:3-isopropylmalate dehydratase small subunit [Alphaproteobacteria bacterium]
MQKFTTLSGIAAPFPQANVDTDQIIPKQFLKTIARTGLAKGLFYDFRFDAAGKPTKGFVLDRAPYDKASILIAGPNFGCGSSREHAPWALLDAGISCVIAPSFADIFHANCFKNGILPIALPQADVDALMADALDRENPNLTIDLVKQEILRPNGAVVKFKIDPFLRDCLLQGLDEIGLTLAKSAAIATHETRATAARAFLQPRAV